MAGNAGRRHLSRFLLLHWIKLFRVFEVVCCCSLLAFVVLLAFGLHKQLTWSFHVGSFHVGGMMAFINFPMTPYINFNLASISILHGGYLSSDINVQ